MSTTFHVTLLKLKKNVDKNNKSVYSKSLVNAANVYYIYDTIESFVTRTKAESEAHAVTSGEDGEGAV